MAEDIQQQLSLAQSAANGEPDARAQVNEIAHPLIDYHTRKLCKRFCYQHYQHYRCTLKPPAGAAPIDAATCEWGNASYGWMLDDLTRPARLQQYQGKNGASLFDYLYRIANSLPFYERWKDWRFNNRVHIPNFICEIAPAAGRVFIGLRSGQDIPTLAQNNGLEEKQVKQLCSDIVRVLTERHKLYLLDRPVFQSLDSDDDPHTNDSAHSQPDPLSVQDHQVEEDQLREQMQQAWRKLDTIEQYVLQALVIDELDARSVLQALQQMNIALRKGVAADQTTVQQLYYFKRKALAKLGKYL